MKVLKNISRVLFTLLLIISIFGTINVLAEGTIFKITKIEVKEKSVKSTVNNVSLSNGIINNDIVFTDENDYIIYSITIKNDTSDAYIIKSISDDNASQYLEYTYDDLSNVEIASGEEKVFDLKITYKEAIDTLTITNEPVKLSLTYEKKDNQTSTTTPGTTTNPQTGTTTIPTNNTVTNNQNQTTVVTSNPKTGDSITLYIILGIISLVGLVVTTVSKKHLSNALMVITLVSTVILPLGVKADGEVFEIQLNNNVRDAEFNVLYDANGGTYSDGSTVKQVPYRHEEPSNVVYISHTENVDDTGMKLYDYDTYWDNENVVGTNKEDTYENHVITIDGAVGLIVDVYYNGEDWDGVCVWDGESDYDCSYEDDETITGNRLTGSYTDTYVVNGNTLTNMGHSQFILSGDTVTFGYYSDEGDSGDGYGYYAIVRPTGSTLPLIEIENPTVTRDNTIANGWCSETPCNESKRVLPAAISSPTTVYTLWDKDAGRLDKAKFKKYFDNIFVYNGHTNQSIFRSATLEEYNSVKDSLGKENKVSTKFSAHPIYMWSDDTTIYYYSPTGSIVLPEDSSELFFYYSGIKKLDILQFDTSEVKDMSFMFAEMFGLEEVDLSNFDTSNVTNMRQMFFDSYSFKKLDLSSFDTHNVTNMASMFNTFGFSSSSNQSRLDLSSFDTHNVTDMSYMFDTIIGVKEIDISSFDTSSNRSFRNMFSNSHTLAKIYVSDQFVLPTDMSSTNMFRYSSKLEGGAGTAYDSSHYDQTYAHIDGGANNPGYFTDVADMPVLP